jgi:esterase/lipase
MFRTRFKDEIVAEFLPPTHSGRRQKVILLCDGMPGIPRKQPLVEFLAEKGYWVFYPRYRGAWESGGDFLARSPHEDILDVISELPKGFRDAAFGQRFSVANPDIFVIGGSFGGATAILCSLNPGVKKVVANCAVVDWSILPASEKMETSNPSYAAYIREAFGCAYRLSDENWRKLGSGSFFNPWAHIPEIAASKIIMFHCKDDPHVPYQSARRFADQTGVKLHSFQRGGHAKTELIVRRHWETIRKFFGSKARS